MQTPVVMIVFRRPDVTRQVFQQVAKAKPKHLFVIADGARHVSEQADCDAARAIFEEVDWDCIVHKNYSDHNLGLRQRVVTGLNWVFEQVEEAIILEDDCLPDMSFFQFCSELLEYYRDDERVMHISGINVIPKHPMNTSYYFSRYPHVWGWATWRRAWMKYDPNLLAWQDEINQQNILQLFSSPNEKRYWQTVWNRVLVGKLNTWDYQWVLSLIHETRLAITPSKNLVSNLGFGRDGTNTRTTQSELASIQTEAMHFPLKHPAQVLRNSAADEATAQIFFQKYPLIEHCMRAVLRKLRII